MREENVGLCLMTKQKARSKPEGGGQGREKERARICLTEELSSEGPFRFKEQWSDKTESRPCLVVVQRTRYLAQGLQGINNSISQRDGRFLTFILVKCIPQINLIASHFLLVCNKFCPVPSTFVCFHKVNSFSSENVLHFQQPRMKKIISSFFFAVDGECCFHDP